MKMHVRAFLEMAHYYRQFIPAFTELTSPLTDITQRGAYHPVQWTEYCDIVAFAKVKKALCGKPSYFTPIFDFLFVLKSNRWNMGLGTLLSQEVKWVDHPVLYHSRKQGRNNAYTVSCLLSGQWAPYCTTSWDAPSPSAWTTLAPPLFRFEVVHRPGLQMVFADFLFHLPEQGREALAVDRMFPGITRALGLCGMKGGVEPQVSVIDAAVGDGHD